MPFNGAGVFQRVRNWVADAAAGIKIRADLHDSEDDNFAAGISNCIARDGQSTITQNIPWNSKRITGLQDPVNEQDAVTKKWAVDELAKKASLDGATEFTGDITIRKADPTLHFKDPGPGTNALKGYKGPKGEDPEADEAKLRWTVRLGNATPETGDNSGSNFEIVAHSDAGDVLFNAFWIDRNTGLASIGVGPSAYNNLTHKGYVDAKAVEAANTRVLRAGDTMTGELVSAGSTGINTGGPVGSFRVQSLTGHAAMSFYTIGGAFAANFGLNSDGNFYMGGWSHGGALYKFWTTRDFASLPSGGATSARIVHTADWMVAYGSGIMVEPYNGAFMTGAYPNSTDITAFRFRQLQIYMGGTWYTVAYA